jgi:carbamoyl-phosphate synthase/aspartate carbamoyltransferase
LPKKNILFSIGSYKEKLELLPSVKKLHELGYNIFATTGTADFISEHDIPVKHLDLLDGDVDDKLKAEYSLQQHLSNNLIDMYINLPSRNRFRRPASYMSKGYRSRRMAVDYSIPLLTNVKCAKLFVEALARKTDFEILGVDFKSSSTTASLPGLFNINTFLASIDDLGQVTEASLKSGFTTVSTVCANVNSQASLVAAGDAAHKAAHVDYLLNFTATADNADQLESVASSAAAVYINTNKIGSGNVSAFDAVFDAWPSDRLMITEAKGTDLASLLLLASIHSRVIHVTNVTSKDDLALIEMTKNKGLKVTCDVSVYSLFLNSEDADMLPSVADQDGLWKKLKVIDCFSIGSTASKLDVSATAGIEEALPLLLTAVADGRLSLQDISERLNENPRRIFGLSGQPDTSIDVELDRPKTWTSGVLSGKKTLGLVSRVVVSGATVFMDGVVRNERTAGRDLSVQAKADVPLKKKTESAGDEAITDVPDTAPERKSVQSFDPVKLAGAADQQLVPLSSPTYEISASLARVVSRSPFYRKHILRSKQFDRSDLHLLFGVAHEMRNLVELYGSINLLQGRVMSTMFFEPSTRTSSSFEAAMYRLGGRVVSVDATTSSVQKGETLGDTVRTLGCYADVIVLRHPQPGSAQIAAKYSKVPIINAGDGIGEHPSQAFLDVFTIREELGTVTGLTITMVGDLKNGRTVHSLAKILAYYQVTINYVCPESLSMPKEVVEEVAAAGIKQNVYSSLDEVIGTTDVLYMTRVQKERFETEEEYNRVKDAFILNNDVLSRAKSQMIVLHPLPRVNEIEPEVDFDQRAAYFRQMRYGLYVRMALLALVMGTLRG